MGHFENNEFFCAMEGGTKTKQLKFKEADKALGPNDIPTTVSPNAVLMAGGKDGAPRADGDLKATDTRQRGAVDEQFPTDALTRSSKKDVEMTEKLQLQKESEDAGRAGMTPFGKLIADREDFAWLRGLREKEAEADFQQWFATNFDHMSPEEKQFAREILPEFYAQRVTQLRKDLSLASKVAELKLLGIQDKKDLMLQYALESGLVDVDRIKHILNPEAADRAREVAHRNRVFRRGLLNPKRLPRGDWGASLRAANATEAVNTALTGAETLGIGNNGFSAYTPGLTSSAVPDNQSWEGRAQWGQLLDTARNN